MMTEFKTPLKDWVFCSIYRTSKLLAWIHGVVWHQQTLPLISSLKIDYNTKNLFFLSTKKIYILFLSTKKIGNANSRKKSNLMKMWILSKLWVNCVAFFSRLHAKSIFKNNSKWLVRSVLLYFVLNGQKFCQKFCFWEANG